MRTGNRYTSFNNIDLSIYSIQVNVLYSMFHLVVWSFMAIMKWDKYRPCNYVLESSVIQTKAVQRSGRRKLMMPMQTFLSLNLHIQMKNKWKKEMNPSFKMHVILYILCCSYHLHMWLTSDLFKDLLVVPEMSLGCTGVSSRHFRKITTELIKHHPTFESKDEFLYLAKSSNMDCT